ncbi:hypothetical protein HY251_16015 [bacterium]|nr:hypothetical protein [bacterium]
MQTWKTAAAVLLAVSLLPGCLERKERIVVRADGTIAIAHALKGDQGEFARDGLGIGAPWIVKDEDVVRDDAKGKDHVRSAEATFARMEDVPESFGTAGDPAPLHARTTLRTERLKDGRTRYTFERRYEARAFAWKQRIFEKNFPDELMRKLERHDGDPPLSEDKLRAATTALLQFEREKDEVLLDDALKAVTSADTVAQLSARAGFGRSFDAAWKVDDLLHWMELSPEESAKLDKRFHEETEKAARAAAADALVDPSSLPGVRADLEAKVGKEFTKLRRILEETDALQGHSFEVKLELPCPITLSDADSIEGDGKVAVWKFGGKDMFDRERVLRVVAESKP